MTAAFEEQLGLLHELQEIDLALHRYHLQLAALPERVASLETDYNTVKGQFDAITAELADVEHRRRTDESELAASVDHLREREAKLYAIKTNKEYQAALKEISEGKRINKEREDRILQAMERIEALTAEKAQLDGSRAEKESAFRSAQEEIRREEIEIRQLISEHEQHRPALLARIDRDVLRKYDTVRHRTPDVLVTVQGGVCNGCSRRVPPQLYNEMLRRDGLKVCPNCQRLLYAAAETEAETAGE